MIDIMQLIRTLLKPMKLFGLCFVYASTIVFWRIWVVGATHGGRVIIETNTIGEQAAEFTIMFCGVHPEINLRYCKREDVRTMARGVISISDEDIIRLYKEGKFIRQISQTFKTSRERIQKVLDYAGIREGGQGSV